MKRVLSVFFILIITVVCFFSASAHPGRTDGRGGHWNHDTGEYHFHSGEYAGKSSSYSSSSSSSSSFTADIWYERGLNDGLRQRCAEYRYNKGYEHGFEKAQNEFFDNYPLFKIMIKNDTRDILYISTLYRSKTEQDEERSNHFSKYHIPSSYSAQEKYSAFTNYNDGYNESYENGNIYALIDNIDSSDDYQKGYQEGYEQFTSSYIYAYKETYPVEAFFILIPSSVLLSIFAIFCISLILIIYLKRKKKQQNCQKEIENTHNEKHLTVGKDISAGNVKIIPKTNSASIKIIRTQKTKRTIIKPITESQLIRLYDGDVLYLYDCSVYHTWVNRHPSKNRKTVPQSIAEDSSSSAASLNSVQMNPLEKCFVVGKDIPEGYIEFTPNSLVSYIKIKTTKDSNESTIKRIKEPRKIYLKNDNIVYVYDCSIDYPSYNQQCPQSYQLAIAELHNKGIIHADLKTSSLASNSKSCPPSKTITPKPSPSFVFEVGNDLYPGVYYFSKTDSKKDAYFISKSIVSGNNKTTTYINKDEQRYFVEEGEILELYNCHIEPYYT